MTSGFETPRTSAPQPKGFETVAGAPSSTTEGDDVPSPMADLPAGATFGSLVHGVLEHADPQAPDLQAELRRHVAEQRRWWSVDTPTDELAEALLPMQHTSLGPLAGGLRLAGHRAARPAARAGLRVPARRRRPSRQGAPRGAPGPDRRRAPPAPACRRPDAGLRRPAGVAVAGRPAPARLPEWLDRRGAAGPGLTRQRPAPLRRRRLQDQQARRPGAPADRARLHAGADDRGDAALALPAAGAALLRRPAPLPALAAAPTTTRSATSAASSTSTCAACAARRRRRSTASRAACSPGTRRPRWCSSSPTCCPGRWRSRDRRPATTVGWPCGLPACSRSSTAPTCSVRPTSTSPPASGR